MSIEYCPGCNLPSSDLCHACCVNLAKALEHLENGPTELYQCPGCQKNQEEAGLCGSCYVELMKEDTGYRTYQDRISYKVSQFVKRIFSIPRGQTVNTHTCANMRERAEKRRQGVDLALLIRRLSDQQAVMLASTLVENVPPDKLRQTIQQFSNFL